ncbi:MAG TPA: VOC family protein [Bellilinea sp.]|nr:VOC family protein [Bellilinea sp.]
MTKLAVYYSFAGKAEEALEFYSDVFGGTVKSKMRYSEGPAEFSKDPVMANWLMHGSAKLTDNMDIGVSDALPEYAQINIGNQIEVMVETDTEAEADRIFARLAEGGKVIMPMEVQFWGDYYGSLVDKYGNPWSLIKGTL